MLFRDHSCSIASLSAGLRGRSGVRGNEQRQEGEKKKRIQGQRPTHIDGDMAYDTSVMWQTNILILVVNTFGLDGAA
jgi:hypothetical protein